MLSSFSSAFDSAYGKCGTAYRHPAICRNGCIPFYRNRSVREDRSPSVSASCNPEDRVQYQKHKAGHPYTFFSHVPSIRSGSLSSACCMRHTHHRPHIRCNSRETWQHGRRFGWADNLRGYCSCRQPCRCSTPTFMNPSSLSFWCMQ